MHLPLSVALSPRLTVLDECGSTNTELVARAADSVDFDVLVTDNQTSGRGRLGREWVAPPGETIAISVLLRPRLPAGEALNLEHYGWLPLIAGIAMTTAITPLVPEHSVTLKWPNDVLIDGRKVSGILGELLQAADGVVMGAGVNLTIDKEGLPTATSTSLALNGALTEGLADAVLSRYLAEFRELYTAFLRYGADAKASGATDLIEELCSTLGQQVRVELPGGDQLFGTAIGVDASGRLIVRRSTDAAVVAVAAGDVTHVRYE
jgi:BirA family biotin operon repressor/biotin-[acetyl-CoA-carboxylase] ligase